MHGDAAFAGQGIVAECFAMSGLPVITLVEQFILLLIIKLVLQQPLDSQDLPISI